MFNFPDDLVRQAKAAELLGVSESTIKSWHVNNRRSASIPEAPGHYKRGKITLYSVLELHNYVEMTTRRGF
jgi:transposase